MPFVKRPESEPYRRFRAEVHVLKKLGNDPGVLPLLYSNVPSHPSRDDPAWLAMPVAEPIRRALGSAPRIDDVVGAVSAIAATLARLAERDIHHRDIKPGNLFRFENRWVIGDFGLADFPEKEELTAEGRRMGPLFFMPPEMLNSPHVAEGEPADVYSLAKTLWVLASEQNFPPQGEQRRDMPGGRLSDAVMHERIHLLDRLIELCTRHDPSARPSIKSVTEELQAWMAAPHVSDAVDATDLADELATLLGPALAEDKRRNEWRNEAAACFQRIHDHLGVIAAQLRAIGLQGNVTTGHSMSEYTMSLLPRGEVTGADDLLWQNYSAIPVKAPGEHSGHLWAAV